MATATQVPAQTLTLEQYLKTSCHPDCDFAYGRLEKRHVGTKPHSRLVALLIG